MRDKYRHRKQLLALLLFGPLIAGCSGGVSELFQSDLLSKDAEWFSRSGRLFIRNVSIETPPLSPDKPVTTEDLVSADGFCAGMATPANANALTEVSKPKLEGLAKKVNYGTQDSPERAVPRSKDNKWHRYVAVGE